MRGGAHPSDRILTLHPEGKAGVNLEAAKYVAVKNAILSVLRDEPAGVPFLELPKRVRQRLDRRPFGPGDSLAWYCVTIKLDLEARGLIERIPGSRRQLLRLKSAPEKA